MPPCTHFCQRDLEAQTTLALTRLNLSMPASLPASCLRTHAAAPHRSVNAVALVVRGESFRHFTRPSPSSSYDVPAALRRRLVCSPSTHALQAALAANHVANLIEACHRGLEPLTSRAQAGLLLTRVSIALASRWSAVARGSRYSSPPMAAGT